MIIVLRKFHEDEIMFLGLALSFGRRVMMRKLAFFEGVSLLGALASPVRRNDGLAG
jgi:hypothetical protein